MDDLIQIIRNFSITDRFLNRIKHQSLKTTLFLYILAAVLGICICYLFTIPMCQSWIKIIAGSQEFDMASEDNKVARGFYYFQTYSILGYTVVAIFIVTNLFYKNHLQEPFFLLKSQAEHIKDNDLSFSCRYESQDEIQEICMAYEKMRLGLLTEQQKMEELVVEQKKLNAAFAHDLRTPLTVVKGYTQLLTNYYPQGIISQEKLMDTLDLMHQQVEKLQEFSNTMQKIHALDQRKLSPHFRNIAELGKRVEAVTSAFCSEKSIQLYVIDWPHPILVDENMVLEVFYNLFSNALRFATHNIHITLEADKDMLRIYVRDDGRGFGNMELLEAEKPYYSSNKEEDHFGLGLTIAGIYCRKHGGELTLANSIEGGAIVCGSFSLQL